MNWQLNSFPSEYSYLMIAFRSRIPTENGTGSVCTYNKAGRIIDGPYMGGNAHSVHPARNRFHHYWKDVVPWCDCCRGDPAANRTVLKDRFANKSLLLALTYYLLRTPSTSTSENSHR